MEVVPVSVAMPRNPSRNRLLQRSLLTACGQPTVGAPNGDHGARQPSRS